jgi:hypothetical protein
VAWETGKEFTTEDTEGTEEDGELKVEKKNCAVRG